MLDFITVSDPDTRLDKLLACHYSNFSRSYFQYLILQGAVLVNDEVVKKSCKLKIGDEIQVHFILTKEIALEPENIVLDILYEDEHLIAVNKPAGLVVHPAVGNWTGTFVNALLYHCKHIERDDSLRPGIVHRLDKETSGVLIAAKNQAMHQALTELFSERKIEKRYIAVCKGRPSVTTIDAPIGRHPTQRKLMTVCETGKHAKTHIQVRASNGVFSVLEIGLETGRTHQIRVHLKHIGHPLVGDPVYGTVAFNDRFAIDRQMLHAMSLSFIHPVTKEPLVINARLPDDIAQVVTKISS